MTRLVALAAVLLAALGTATAAVDDRDLRQAAVAVGRDIGAPGLFVEFVRVLGASSCTAAGPNTATTSPILWADPSAAERVATAFGARTSELLGARFVPGDRKRPPSLRAGIRIGTERAFVGLREEPAKKGAAARTASLTAQRFGSKAPFADLRVRIIPGTTTLVARPLDGEGAECLLVAITPLAGAGLLADAILERDVAPAPGNDSDIAPPRLVERREPDYPADLRREQENGRVLLAEEIDERGHVAVVSVLDRAAPAAMVVAAMDAVLQWEYEPARRAGARVRVFGVVTVRFDRSF
jgi:TonB family protein